MRKALLGRIVVIPLVCEQLTLIFTLKFHKKKFCFIAEHLCYPDGKLLVVLGYIP